MPRGESIGDRFDISDKDDMSPEENTTKEAAMHAEARAALKDAQKTELDELLEELADDSDAFELADKHEQITQLSDEDIEFISDEEANIAEALNDTRKIAQKTPPPLPRTLRPASSETPQKPQQAEQQTELLDSDLLEEDTSDAIEMESEEPSEAENAQAEQQAAQKRQQRIVELRNEALNLIQAIRATSATVTPIQYQQRLNQVRAEQRQLEAAQDAFNEEQRQKAKKRPRSVA